MYDAEEVATGDEEVDMDEVRAKYVTYCSKYHQASSQGKSLHPLSASSPLPFFSSCVSFVPWFVWGRIVRWTKSTCVCKNRYACEDKHSSMHECV